MAYTGIIKEGESPRTRKPTRQEGITMAIIVTTTTPVISKYDVMRAGKVVETFDTYEEARRYASQYVGAVIRWYISTK